MRNKFHMVFGEKSLLPLLHYCGATYRGRFFLCLNRESGIRFNSNLVKRHGTGFKKNNKVQFGFDIQNRACGIRFQLTQAQPTPCGRQSSS